MVCFTFGKVFKLPELAPQLLYPNLPNFTFISPFLRSTILPPINHTTTMSNFSFNGSSDEGSEDQMQSQTGNGESSSQQRADSDIAALSAQMKSSFEPVINTMMDSFVDCKLRMLQSHTETIADKDLMYTTKVL